MVNKNSLIFIYSKSKFTNFDSNIHFKVYICVRLHMSYTYMVSWTLMSATWDSHNKINVEFRINIAIKPVPVGTCLNPS